MLVATRSLSGRTLRIIAMLVILASLLAGRQAAAFHEETLLTDAPGAQTDGRTDSEWVVWLDRGEQPAGQADIYAARLSDRIAFPVSAEAFDHTMPAIDNGVVVWAEHDDDNAPWTIIARDLATGERLTVGSSMSPPNPRISGTRIVWSDRDPESGEPILLTHDIATDEEPIVLATALDGAEGIWDVEIAGTHIIWWEGFLGDYSWTWWIRTVEMAGVDPGTPVTTAEGSMYPPSFDVGGDVAVYSDNLGLYAVDLISGATRTLYDPTPPSSRDPRDPTTDGRYVFWQDNWFQDGDTHASLMGYDLMTDMLYTVIADIDTYQSLQPDTAAGYLVWQTGPDQERDIHAAPLVDLLPDRDEAFDAVWARTDRPVAEGVVDRTWIWGPEPITPVISEPYVESPGETRQVQYFDKSRMEITQPENGDPESVWYVTNGLLAVELVTGNMQTGDYTFVPRLPAEINIAGDQGFVNGPTYASFPWSFPEEFDQPNDRGDALVVERVSPAGQVTTDQSLGEQAIRLAAYDEVTNHNIAAPFWSFMTSSGTVYEGDAYVDARLFENAYYATGRPISEPYWSDVVVARNERLVLIQCFERRCLTYTPGNPDGWQVEAGNIGRHYHDWRYAEPPAIEGQLLFFRRGWNPERDIPVTDLYIINADGSEPRNLTIDLDDDIEDAVWSPDGSRIAFSASGDLYVMDADGGNRQQITTGEEIDARPDWSPDGTSIAFERGLSEHETQIFIVATDGTGERQLSDIPPAQDSDHSFSTAPDWSPDGQRIAFTSDNVVVPWPGSSPNVVYVVNADGTNLIQLAPPDASGAYEFTEPNWSPDGTELVVFEPQMGGRDLDGSALYRIDVGVGASSLRLIAGQDASDPEPPTWSPVDTRMATTLTPVVEPFTYETYGKRGIHTIDFTTGEKQQITHTGYLPSWSSDGQYLAFEFGGRVSFGVRAIAITDLTGRTQWVVTGDGERPQWRPGQTDTSP